MYSLYWHPALLTSSGRPMLEPGEHDNLIQDGVGLYQGDRKCVQYYSGRVYLTNKRVFFINESTTSYGSVRYPYIYLDLADVLRAELYSGFLKSSPKVTLYMTPSKVALPAKTKDGSAQGDGNGASGAQNGSSVASATVEDITWVCPICYYSNTLSASQTRLRLMSTGEELPACKTCGVTASYDTIKEAREEQTKASSSNSTEEIDLLTFDGSQCPRCTFVNHPSMMNCEMCGAPLAGSDVPSELLQPDVMRHSISGGDGRRVKLKLEENSTTAAPTVIRFSFRNGGAHNFYAKVSECIEEEHWAKIQAVDGTNRGASRLNEEDHLEDAMRSVGIHGLQSSSSQKNYETSLILNDSLQDLQNLLEKGKELVAVGRKYQRVLLGAKQRSMTSIDDNLELLHQSQNSMRILDQIVAKNELSKARTNTQKVTSLTNMKRAAKQKSGKDKQAMVQLYLEELSRHICEFIVDENVLDKYGGLVTLYELYTMYNEARGIDLVSPQELFDAASMFQKLNLSYQLAEIPITQQASKKKNDRKPSKKDPEKKLYIIARQRMESQSISSKLLALLREKPGLTVLQIQQTEFQMNYLIIESLLNRLLNDGEVAVDKAIEGEFFYVNEIKAFNWDKWKKESVAPEAEQEGEAEVEADMGSVPMAPDPTDGILPVFRTKTNEKSRSSERLKELGDLDFS